MTDTFAEIARNHTDITYINDYTYRAHAHYIVYKYDNWISYWFNVDAHRDTEHWKYECQCFVSPEIDQDGCVNVFCWNVYGIFENINATCCQYCQRKVYYLKYGAQYVESWLPYLHLLIQQVLFGNSFNILPLNKIKILPISKQVISKHSELSRKRAIANSILGLTPQLPFDVCRLIGEKQNTPRWIRYFENYLQINQPGNTDIYNSDLTSFVHFQRQLDKNIYMLEKYNMWGRSFPNEFKCMDGSPFKFEYLYINNFFGYQHLMQDTMHPSYHLPRPIFSVPPPQTPQPYESNETYMIDDLEVENDKEEEPYIDELDLFEYDNLLVRAKRRNARKRKALRSSLLKHKSL